MVLSKYMKTQERGIPKPQPPKHGMTQSIHVPKETTYLGKTQGIFRSTDPYCYLIQKSTPLLLDRSNTPRKAFRQISLDRNYTNQRWCYNKNLGHDFAPGHAQKDIAKSKMLRKITKKEDKMRTTLGGNTLGNKTMSQTFDDSRRINTAN